MRRVLLLSHSLIYSLILLFPKYLLSSSLYQTPAFSLPAFINWAEAVLSVFPSALSSLLCTHSYGLRNGGFPGVTFELCLKVGEG